MWGARVRVLIVEDEGFIALDMEATLTDAGCKVVGIAASVNGALTILNNVGCDGVVLDANLGGEDPTAIAEVLRSRQIPFLVVSGYERLEGDLGVFADTPFLAKPYTSAALVAKVRALTEEPAKTA